MEHTTLFIIGFYSVTYIGVIIIFYLHNLYLQYQGAINSISDMPFY
jgi:predicted ATP-grasp superfamily ATP-dependent carboligase